jgi:hypothetical protein
MASTLKAAAVLCAALALVMGQPAACVDDAERVPLCDKNTECRRNCIQVPLLDKLVCPYDPECSALIESCKTACESCLFGCDRVSTACKTPRSTAADVCKGISNEEGPNPRPRVRMG